VSLPDVLGYIAGGEITTVGEVQCALAVNPREVPAGLNFEALLLLQSMYEAPVDVLVKLLLPAKDAGGERGKIFTKTDRLLVGLEPAEVGVVVLPISTSPLTTQAVEYAVGVELKVKRQGRGHQVREPNAMARFDPHDAGLSDEIQARLDELHGLQFSGHQYKRERLLARFDIIEPTGPSLGLDLAPSWQSLWTMRDHIDENIIKEKAGELAQGMLPSLRRDRVFKPIMQAVQSRFENAGYPLHTGEALYITKLMTLVLEMGESMGPDLPTSRWYVRLCRLLYADERAASYPEQLVVKPLWRDLVYDATVLGFQMITTITRRNVGSLVEAATGQKLEKMSSEAVLDMYAQELADRLSQDEPADEAVLDFSVAYVPLVLGGLVANTRVTMPGESVLDSVHLLNKARDDRRGEMRDGNAAIFDISERLIDRALDMF
jgi:hypothetical protein